ncbi:MAG: adenylate cyclase [Actinomycetota bacterium]|jgi:class 3 adenylate cyclase/CHASE3 domain sensor protein|nr:adenylate cyclase [Actinomycetota bacterium]
MSTTGVPPGSPRSAHQAERELGPLPGFLRPFVDRVARIRATVHTKLLAAFLTIAVLLLAMGVLSVVVLDRVNSQVDRLTALNEQTDLAREMIYKVTAQMHYRAMSLLQTDDPEWPQKITSAKADFATYLGEIRAYPEPDRTAFFAGLDATNTLFDASSAEVTALFDAGKITQALNLHLSQEHLISHKLEASLNGLIDDSEHRVQAETAAFKSDRRFLTFAVASFSAVSIFGALLLGAVLSWSLIRPVRKVDQALAAIAGGNFGTRVEVPNRDEFGNLTTNLNRTSAQLATVYSDLESLNANLQETVDAKVSELERASRLKRYLSPGLADSIIAGEQDIHLGSSRKFLTIFFSDVRGFTAAAERMEPEELVAELNDYLTEMTEIVFKHGGTLDKYVGDAVMVFFGDPVHQHDHAERAVRMAFEMRERMTELRETWLRKYHDAFEIGIGIATGWVTVGDIGSAARSDYTVLGNEVNLASRLADRADPGQILVTERTMKSVDELARGVVIDEVSLKGISRPITVYELSTLGG